MGTGVISALFDAFPYYSNEAILHGCAAAFVAFNAVLFSLFLAMTITRYALYPEIWKIMLMHPVQSLYLSCIPMGFATLLNGGVLLSKHYGFGGTSFVWVLSAAWWLDAAASLLICLGMVHVMITRHRHALEQATAAWLLPVVAPIVTSTAGHVVASALSQHSPNHALVMSSVALVLVCLGLALVFMILPIYLHRLILHGLPGSGLIISSFLPIGPAGQAGYSLILVADLLPTLLRGSNSPFLNSDAAISALRILLLAGAFILWTIGTMWLLFACAAMIEIVARNRISFALPWWGLVFPNGVYALLTLKLGEALGGSAFFVRFGAGWAVVTMLLWVLLAIPTTRFTIEGTIFLAPCLGQAELSLPTRDDSASA
ncbi:C4-dicarboxylate transporter/malic acid transport protein [Auriculariales sp. MPI-PUGE-AT-0066]|nr:C4-dicarboxylate transporter/malic acid transport protein [Auriculariales sp. MPI-PUGE-AT-0066]